MKLCIFTNHFYPEDFKVNDIAFELAKRGYQITVITAIPDYPQGKYYKGYSLFKKRRETIQNVRVIRLPLIPRGNGSTGRLFLNYASYFISVLFFTFFHSLRNKYDAAFVHLTSPFFVGLAAALLKKRQKIPLVFWVLDLWPESVSAAGGISAKSVLKPLTSMVQYVYDACDTILISSQSFKKSICEKGDYEKKLVYFPNWAEDITPQKTDFDCSSVFPFNTFLPDDFIFLFAGNIGEAQNIGFILETLSDMLLPANAKFVFLGDGRFRAELLKQITERKLEKTVFAPGRFPLETMPFFMKKAQVMVVSLKDALIFNQTVPAKMQFYMAQGKPVLAMLNGEGADLVAQAQCGFSVPVNDTEQFKKIIPEIMALPPETLQKMGASGRAYYDAVFSKSLRLNQLDILFNSFFSQPVIKYPTTKKSLTELKY